MSEERNPVTRIVFCLLWLLPVMIVIHSIVGGFVGGIAGPSGEGVEDSFNAGARASAEFFAKNRLAMTVIDVAVWGYLCFIGWLPGTSTIKKSKKNT